MTGHFPSSAPILALHGIVKDFPGTRALNGIDFELYPGEIHAMVGENGSGKSTMINIISGVLIPGAGSIHLGGEQVSFRKPADALQRGIATVYQDVHLVPLLSVASNLLLGTERIRPGGPPGLILERAKQVLEVLGASFSLSVRVVDLTHAEKQFVQIARAIALAVSVVMFDEPTEGLSEPQYDRLQQLLRELRSQGLGIVYVSHRLGEVISIADRISVLRDGKCVGTVEQATREELIRMMVGKVPLERNERNDSVQAAASPGPMLRVRNLTRKGVLNGISLEVKAGEIVALAGVPGSRKSELLRAVCGADSYDEGNIEIAGIPVPMGSPQAAFHRGVLFLPADRKGEGLVLPGSVCTNIVLPEVEGFTRWGFRRRKKEASAASRFVEQLRIRTPGVETSVRNLSGGNQQKVLFARVKHAGARVILLDEPTQGVDIAGKSEIHGLIQEMARQGAAIVVASSDMEELIKIAHRILVIRLGSLVGEFHSTEADPEAILHLALP